MPPIRYLFPFVVVLAMRWSTEPGALAARDAAGPSFAERVAAEDAVLRLLASHAGVASGDFRTRVPRDVAETRARRTLALSEALGAHWNTPITREMLDAEVRRMTRSSVMPGRLRERFAALGDDPLLIREVIARPALADRLARNFFASDRRIHAGAWREAEELRRELSGGRVDPRAPRPGREEITIDVAAPTPGMPAPIAEESDRLIIDVPLESRDDDWLVARYTVAKRGWDDWWAEEGARFAVETLSHGGAAPGAARAGGAAQVPSAAEWASLEAAATCTPDTWSVMHGVAPDALRDSRVVWTGNLALIWGGQRQYASGWRYDPALNDWTPMSLDGAPPFASLPAAVWTGSRMIVWGGTRTGTGPVTSGGIYDPVADTWTTTTTTGAPAARYGHTAVWTGSKMVVWGGIATPAMTESATGGAYDPALDQWTATQETGAPTPRTDHTAVWTGSAMLVWGGCSAGTGCDLYGGSYDPLFDTWSALTVVGGMTPEGRGRHTAVWTGDRMIIWGGSNQQGSRLQTGGIYDPASGWAFTALLNAPAARQDHTAVWTGSRMIAWGGRSNDINPVFSGGIYDPTSDSWSATTTTNVPLGRVGHVAVWTGSQMVVWGGAVGQHPVPVNSGGRYDPVTNSWTPTFQGTQAGFGPFNPFSAWTGNQLLMWGGGSTSGGLYDPATDVWSYTTALTGPLNSPVWTGNRMLTWGGSYTACCQCPPGGTGPYQVFLDGGLFYDPLTNVWGTLPFSGGTMPAKRVGHAAVWNGTEMVVWGGYYDIPCDGPRIYVDGFRYNPETGIYTPLPSNGSPPLGFGFSGYRTDSGVLFWNWNLGPYIYRRESDSWTHGDSTGTSGGTWTSIGGGQLVSFGSSGGGRYDPVADAWRPTSPTGPYPVCNPGVTASSGAEVLWWGGGGGQNCNFSADAGAHYDPVADLWTPTSMVDPPPPSRSTVPGVWSGEQILWWDANTHLGFAYCMPGQGPCFQDLDGDGYGDPEAGAQCNAPGVAWNALDCDDGNPARGGRAGETSGLAFTSGSDLTWTAPATPAGAAFFYDLLRGDRADDLSGAACVATDVPVPAASDLAVPAPGAVHYYYVRASTCPGGAVEGTLGKGTLGTPGRFAPLCP